MIRSFLGLTNFFRGNIQNYANIAAPLNRLLRKGSQYSGGDMPDEAAEAFQQLKRILCSAPRHSCSQTKKNSSLRFY